MTSSRRNLDRERPALTLPKRTLTLGLGLFLTLAGLAGAQSWAPLTHQPGFSAGTALLLTDGTVMVQQMAAGGFGTGNWWRLTPDSFGSYQNGTWSQLASMPAGYAPLYYASAVLPDGRVVVEGGEYNNTQSSNSILGAIYNPATNTWSSIAPPAGIAQIGDASSVILANGTFMLGPCCFQTTDWLLNPSTLTWTATGTGKADVNAEEGWTLLPNGNVLTVDTGNGTSSEVYNPSTGAWSSAGSTLVQLPLGTAQYYPEIGPAVLRPDGTVVATGATSNTAIYNSASGAWSAGPTFPNGLDLADGPAALLPNGNVLAMASPGFFTAPSHFFELNGSIRTQVAEPPGAAGDASYAGRMLVLPTGQILLTDSTGDVELYTASGTYQSAWQPTINSFPSSVTAGSASNSLTGWQLNGLSQGAMYGDDAQSATNYPLLRIINNATGHVSYARTHNHSSMGVATGAAIVSTLFDVPASAETGASTLQVVANGIPSPAVAVTVAAGSAAHFGAYEDWTGNPYYGSLGTFFADIDGDGRADALVVNADRIVARRSTGLSFGGYEDWTGNPYSGSRGTFFADIDGDHKADAIVVNDDRILVRRSTGLSFSGAEDWTGNPYYGSRGTFFADVDGDGKADAIVVNDDRITVRRSSGMSFGAYESWTNNPYYGTLGTFFADVDGDGKADAIVVNPAGITVRRSTGLGFGAYESWTGNPWFGSRGTFFADVDGDGRADAITVNDDRIMVRRSTGSSFGAAEDWTANPYYGSRGTFFADVNGDHRADAIVVNDDRIVVRRSTGAP